jgi:diadenosine tetraphosphate (Ap4A) HIT family hydrolase
MTNPDSVNCPLPPLFANQHFTVEPCSSCVVPGYLIVAPKLPVTSLAELNSAALAALGPTLALATHVIEVVIQPERVYCALFAEQTRHVHFHLFPRTAELARQFLASHPEDAVISGPRLLDWARRTLPRAAPENDDVTEKLRAYCKNHVSDPTMPA